MFEFHLNPLPHLAQDLEDDSVRSQYPRLINEGVHFTICLAFSSSSQRSRFEAMPALDEIQFRSTRKESYTPSWIGSIGSPVVRLSPTTLPSLCSSWSAATNIHCQLSLQFAQFAQFGPYLDNSYSSPGYHGPNWQLAS